MPTVMQDAVPDEVQVGVGLLEEVLSQGSQGEEANIDVLPKFVILRFAKAGVEPASTALTRMGLHVLDQHAFHILFF